MTSHITFWTALFIAIAGIGSQNVNFSNTTLNFAFKLLQNFAQTPGNVVFSPTSVDILLSVLQEGAGLKSTTAIQLANVLHRRKIASRNGYKSFMNSIHAETNPAVKHQMSSRIYVNPSVQIRQTFIQIANSVFRTDLAELPPDAQQAAATINKWVSNVTSGHITQLIEPGSLSDNAAMVLLSTMYFKGEWMEKFTDVRQEKFQLTETNHTPVPFLVNVKTLVAGREEEYKWIELPYVGGTYSMYVLRPTTEYSHNLNGMLNKITAAKISEMLSARTTRNVYLRMPKFKIRQSPPVKEALVQMGLRDVFTSAADLSDLGQSLWVSNLAHEAVLDVNEAGSEAAAATGAVIHTLSASWSPDDLDFRLDQPFLVFIVHKPLAIPILVAKVVDPR